MNHLLKSQATKAMLIVLLGLISAQGAEEKRMEKKYRELTSEEARVILKKGTEAPFTGKYEKAKEPGVYTCRQCGAALYRAEDKFVAHCGWPAFDDEIPGAVRREVDADGRRTEILCASCGGHLGHIFLGEALTKKNVRHCVNSISMDFVAEKNLDIPFKRAVFAGGCFWGVEYYLQKAKGVIQAVSGYTGGTVENPTYEEVCRKKTGHVEAVEVLYDPQQTNYETLSRLFFEIHDPTQANGQGPDLGEQYLSVLFYKDKEEKAVAEKLIGLLKEKGLQVATRVEPAKTFWKAESRHQDYYFVTGKQPYCHRPEKRF